tara:strand:- start:29 stop:928 length:900 start_codon:yes stop_codon:yes gene_type:complete
MNVSNKTTISNEEATEADNFHYEVETKALNDLFFSKFRVANDDDGEVIFIKENGDEMFAVKYAKSYLTPAEETYTPNTIQDIIPDMILSEKKTEYRRNKEAEMINEWWGIYTKEEDDGTTMWYAKEGDKIPVGHYSSKWVKEDGKTAWSMLEMRRHLKTHGNLKRDRCRCRWREVLEQYKNDEIYFNECAEHTVNWLGNDFCDTSKMMNKIKNMMRYKSLAGLKRECKRKGITGISGKKKWALINHMIEYDTGFDIYILNEFNKLYEIYDDMEYKPARKKCYKFPYNIICCDPYNYSPW